MIKSAISFLSNGSEAFWEALNMVAPKGCLLMPYDLKF
jgi:hypothetical protein